MGGAKRSRTAQAVAVERAVLTDLGAIDDPYAERMLDPAMGRILCGVRRLPEWARRRSVTLAGLAARVRFHDEQTGDALDGGVDQVVVIGAGYDSRAWRLARPGVRFFELDHPLTQADKGTRAPEGGPTYVPADLRTDEAGPALVAAGLDPARPTAFVMEGVTMYLAEEIVVHQLRSLASTAVSGSVLSLDFYPPQDQGTAGNRRQNRLQRLARRGSGEGLHLTTSRTGAVALIEAAGWRVTDAIGARDAARSLVPPSARLRVDAVNNAKTLLSARSS